MIKMSPLTFIVLLFMMVWGRWPKFWRGEYITFLKALPQWLTALQNAAAIRWKAKAWKTEPMRWKSNRAAEQPGRNVLAFIVPVPQLSHVSRSVQDTFDSAWELLRKSHLSLFCPSQWKQAHVPMNNKTFTDLSSKAKPSHTKGGWQFTRLLWSCQSWPPHTRKQRHVHMGRRGGPTKKRGGLAMLRRGECREKWKSGEWRTKKIWLDSNIRRI